MGGGEAEVSGEGARAGFVLAERLCTLFVTGALLLLPTPTCPVAEPDASFPSYYRDEVVHRRPGSWIVVVRA